MLAADPLHKVKLIYLVEAVEVGVDDAAVAPVIDLNAAVTANVVSATWVGVGTPAEKVRPFGNYFAGGHLRPQKQSPGRWTGPAQMPAESPQQHGPSR